MGATPKKETAVVCLKIFNCEGLTLRGFKNQNTPSFTLEYP